jgi:LmbE family N-acetylglucosaminyl deacetylase
MKKRLVQQFKDYVKTFIRPDNLIIYPDLAEKPAGSRVVVFSPHFDDDVIGCGGTLLKHVLAGDSVTVIYFTDGREGDPSMADKQVLEEVRKKEADNATRLLGISRLIFLDQPESQLKTTDALVKRLKDIIIELKPDLLYIPSFLDNHIDHFETNRILFNLHKECQMSLNIAAYEVWTPILPNTVVDISPLIDKKELALRQYHSQLRQVDYVQTTLALNKYRSAFHLKGQGYAEAFLVVPIREYTDLMTKLRIPGRLFISRK